jgi:hypothetical protein
MLRWTTLTSLDTPAATLLPSAAVAVKRGGLEGSPPAASVFGKVPQVPAWRTSLRPAAASEDWSSRLRTPDAGEIAPQVPSLPRAGPQESPGPQI